ncbi:kelch-like protein 2 [Branchiostoma floridae]|uniref:Kelch-like protein 2 n=1 Tax=Branchiostoma floridae TaxID=7739 RepID=A0A9J7KJK1_BRAFL|nr:kelch-like protein 2 [Branchiostoma floridae]
MNRFFKRLQELRSEGHLVDVTLCAEGKEIPCHRLVLSACSDYFHAMFGGAHSESKKDKIDIREVSAEALEILVDFAYSAKLDITSDNVYLQFEAANMLQVKRLEEAFADKVPCKRLSAEATRCALKDFEETSTTEEFLQLPLDLLKMYISDDGLHVKKEEQVLESIMRWARHNLEERQKHLKELLDCVCFSRVDQDYLKNIIDTEVLLGVPGIMELIKDTSTHRRPRRILQEKILLLGGATGCG